MSKSCPSRRLTKASTPWCKAAPMSATTPSPRQRSKKPTPPSACASSPSTVRRKAKRGSKKPCPGYYLTTLKAGHSNGIIVDTCVQAYDMYLVGHKGLVERTCQRGAKSASGTTSTSSRRSIHRCKNGPASAPSIPDATMAYHPAAVQFYKERKVWPAKMDEAAKKNVGDESVTRRLEFVV